MAQEPPSDALTPMRALAEQSERFGRHWRARRIDRSYLWGAIVLASPALLWLMPATPPSRPAVKIQTERPKDLAGPGTVMHIVVVPTDKSTP